MKKPNLFIYASLLLSLLLACDDVLEEDITDDTVQVITPLSGMVIEGDNVQFVWNELDGADDYRIQVINDQQVNVVDSLTNSTSLEFVLTAGAYQWRVRGENFAYNSTYSFPESFTVVISDDLSNQTVVLQTPSEDIYTNEANVLFTWNSIPSAETYTLEVLKNLNGLQTILLEENLTSTSFAINASTLDEDAEYVWRVKALNDSSETAFTERSFFLDTVIPNQPSLISPTDMSTTSTTVSFNWANGSDTGNIQSSIMNTLEIANDIDFNSVLTTQETQNNTYQYTFDSNGTYYWRVKAVDAASNESDYSIARSIIVQ